MALVLNRDRENRPRLSDDNEGFGMRGIRELMIPAGTQDSTGRSRTAPTIRTAVPFQKSRHSRDCVTVRHLGDGHLPSHRRGRLYRPDGILVRVAVR